MFYFGISKTHHVHSEQVDYMRSCFIIITLTFMDETIDFDHEFLFRTVKICNQKSFLFIDGELNGMLPEKFKTPYLPIPDLFPKYLFSRGAIFSQLSNGFLCDGIIHYFSFSDSPPPLRGFPLSMP